MIPLLFFDLVKAICWAIQLRDMHRYYSKFIQQITDAQVHCKLSSNECQRTQSENMEFYSSLIFQKILIFQ